MPARSTPTARLWLIGALVAALALSAVPATANPTSQELRGRLTDAQAELDQLAHLTESIVEDYNAAQEAYDQVVADREATRAELDALARELAALTRGVEQHVRRLHKLGPAFELSSVFIAGDATEVGAKAAVLRRIVEGQRVDIEELAALQAATQALEVRLAEQEAEARDRAEQLELAREEAEATMHQHQARMAELQRELDRAVAREEAERQRQRELELRRQAAERASQRAAAQRTSTATTTRPANPAPAPRASAQVAVDAALSKLGSPYRWGATGPNRFDCSGLVVWAYRQAGVELPRTSRGQYANLTKISRSDLQPGDLVFAGNPVHHVGIYIGNGQIVHAPHSGTVVSIRSMERPDLRGFARVTG